MNPLKNILRNEPVLIKNFVEAVILMVVGFGIGLSGEQVALFMVVVSSGLALLTRALVTPTANVALTSDEELELRTAGF